MITELKTFENDCTMIINGRTFIIAELIVPAVCNNKNGKYDICQIYELIEQTDDGYINTIYKPVNYFYGASNKPEEIIKTATSYIDEYLKSGN